jgi:uncharacterized protein
MILVEIFFKAELNDFLERSERYGPITICSEEHQTSKHLIESCGVPHTEVGQVSVSGRRVDFSYHPSDGDWLQVLPYSPLEREQSLPPGEIRFLLDMHLGKLARYLRLLGFDSVYRNDFNDDELAEMASREARVLLTRDRRLLMRKQVRYGYCPHTLEPRKQLLEVLYAFNLRNKISPFQRCSHCNGQLLAVSKDSVADLLEPLTKQYYFEFHQCPTCQSVYWKGSHYERMRLWIREALQAAGDLNGQG